MQMRRDTLGLVMGRRSLITLVILVCQIGAASLFSMLTRDQALDLDPGDDVSLQCQFYMDRFNLFYNPILWRKVQYEETHELNIMGNIKEPFDGAEKFKVSFNPLPPRYMLGLSIKNLTRGDSGNYTCEVRGPNSRLLGLVIHTIYVRAPVIDVSVLKQTFNGKPSDMERMPSETSISFIENYPAPIMCLVHGGNPPPQVEIIVGDHDETDKFQLRRSHTLSGPFGFRVVELTTVLYTDTFIAGSQHDGSELHCSTVVPETHNMRASADVKVYYGPRISCQSAAAYVGDHNVHLVCNVRARPGVTSLYWMLDGNGTVVSEGEVVNEYWIINMDQGEDGLQTKLYLRQSRQSSFRTYTLVAENNVAVTTQNVKLRQLYVETKPRPQTVEGQDQKYNGATDRRKDQPSYIFIQNVACESKPRYWAIIMVLFLTVLRHLH